MMHSRLVPVARWFLLGTNTQTRARGRFELESGEVGQENEETAIDMPLLPFRSLLIYQIYQQHDRLNLILASSVAE